MCCEATHAAEKVSSWFQSTADCGSERMSHFFRFFLYFLDLGFSQKFIASDQKQGNKILMTSSATMGLNFWSKIGSPIPMTSQWPQTASFFGFFWYVPFFLIWVVLVWSKRGEPNASVQEKGNPAPMTFISLNFWSNIGAPIPMTSNRVSKQNLVRLGQVVRSIWNPNFIYRP